MNLFAKLYFIPFQPGPLIKYSFWYKSTNTTNCSALDIIPILQYS